MQYMLMRMTRSCQRISCLVRDFSYRSVVFLRRCFLCSMHPHAVSVNPNSKSCLLQVLDLMGFQPSHWNKINIHIGGVYGDKLSTLDRFAQNFERLSDNCKARLTLENDDWGCAFSVKDLLPLSQRCGIPIVFDFHHHKFCSGALLNWCSWIASFPAERVLLQDECMLKEDE